MVIAAADIPKTMVRYCLKLIYCFVLIYKSTSPTFDSQVSNERGVENIGLSNPCSAKTIKKTQPL